MWHNTDPRDNYGCFNIVIIRPSLNGNGSWVSGIGVSDSKYGYYIHTDFEDYKSIDEWNKDWYWTNLP